VIRFHWHLHLLHFATEEIAQEVKAQLPLEQQALHSFSIQSHLLSEENFTTLTEALQQRGYTPRIELPARSSTPTKPRA
jgi:hypothetical protein